MATQTETRPLVPSLEPDAHIASRHFRTGLRILLGLSLIATIICVFFFQKAAYLAAIPVPVLYAVLAFTNYLEFRSRASNLRSDDRQKPTREKLRVDAETVGIITLMKVIGVFAIAAFIIAATLFDWKIVGAATAALFFLTILIQMPFLPLYFSETERDELDKLKRERSQKKG